MKVNNTPVDPYSRALVVRESENLVALRLGLSVHILEERIFSGDLSEEELFASSIHLKIRHNEHKDALLRLAIAVRVFNECSNAVIDRL